MDKISTFISTYFDWFYITVPGTVDIIEILILSFFIYRIMLWFKQSRAWTLLKGIVMIVLFTAIAAVFQFNTILYLLKNAFSVGIIAVVILFQPEFRRGLEQLGRKKLINYIIRDGEDDGVISEKTIYELVKTAQVLSANRTGALIVIENEVALAFQCVKISDNVFETTLYLVKDFQFKFYFCFLNAVAFRPARHLAICHQPQIFFAKGFDQRDRPRIRRPNCGQRHVSAKGQNALVIGYLTLNAVHIHTIDPADMIRIHKHLCHPASYTVRQCQRGRKVQREGCGKHPGEEFLPSSFHCKSLLFLPILLQEKSSTVHF